ncbi:LytR/AlgR family response regulator transcription factor [Eisenbergiella sp.]
MLKIAIVEDNNASAEKLRGFLEQYASDNGENFDITIFGDALAFLDGYKRIYDMVFMDIELPFIDGMEAAKRLRAVDQQVILIFVTNMASFAVKGYEVNALDYLVKPVHYGDFELKLRRAVARSEEAQEAILVVRQSGFLRLRLQEIRYIEVRGHTLIFHTETGLVNGSGTLLETEEKLKNKGFLRCNKCYLVNQKHIAAVQGYTLVMVGGEELQISRPRKKTFMSELAETMGNENVL